MNQFEHRYIYKKLWAITDKSNVEFLAYLARLEKVYRPSTATWHTDVGNYLPFALWVR